LHTEKLDVMIIRRESGHCLAGCHWLFERYLKSKLVLLHMKHIERYRVDRLKQAYAFARKIDKE
jgi:hypothetical protein